MKVLLVDSRGQLITEMLKVVNVSVKGWEGHPEKGEQGSGKELQLRLFFQRGDVMNAYLLRLGQQAMDGEAPDNLLAKRLLGDFLLFTYLSFGRVLDMRKLSVPGVAKIYAEVSDIQSGLSLEDLALADPESRYLDELLFEVAHPLREVNVPFSQEQFEAMHEEVALALVDRHFGEWNKLPATPLEPGSTAWSRTNGAHRRVQQWLRRRLPDEDIRNAVAMLATATTQDLWHKVNAKILEAVQEELTEPEIRAFEFFHLQREPCHDDGPHFPGPLSFYPSLMKLFWDLPRETRALLYLTRFFDVVQDPEKSRIEANVELIVKKLLRLRLDSASLVRGEERRKKVELLGRSRDVAAADGRDPEQADLEEKLVTAKEGAREGAVDQSAATGPLARLLRKLLTPAQFEVLIMHADSMTVTEIARRRGTSHQAVSRLLARARERAGQALRPRHPSRGLQ